MSRQRVQPADANWNSAKAETMPGMFSRAGACNQPIGNWNTADVTSMKYMLHNAAKFNADSAPGTRPP